MCTEGIQIITIPKTGTYFFFLAGAGSFNKKASGAIIEGNVQLEKGEKLYIGVGQFASAALGGSGGTFIAKKVGGDLFSQVFL